MASIDSDDRTLLQRFAETKTDNKITTKELEDMKPRVREILLDLGAENVPVEAEFGKFKLRPRDKFEFSPELQQEIELIEQKKAHEKATGKANLVSTSYDIYFYEVE